MRELEDRPWFPQFLRQHQMEYLSFLSKTFNIYKPVREMLIQNNKSALQNGWTDACSGTGGPIESFHFPYKVLLTDLYPPPYSLNLPTNIVYYTQPVNLETELPPGNGLISLFNGFHHFSDPLKKEIIDRIKQAKRPFFIVEILQPTCRHFIAVLFSTTIGHWLAVPFMKPFSWKRIFFTYIIPLHTLTVCIDGIISVFKSKSRRFYSNLCNQLTEEDYSIQLIQAKGISGNILVLQGGFEP